MEVDKRNRRPLHRYLLMLGFHSIVSYFFKDSSSLNGSAAQPYNTKPFHVSGHGTTVEALYSITAGLTGFRVSVQLQRDEPT